ncbi:MAG: methyl-accepting chemotaxis protein [Ruminococcus sp.]|jgi:methyl-accepting chemotaxis protein|nr:methyl-accepting chemotaxis protein [Ruminococcus sp.]
MNSVSKMVTVISAGAIILTALMLIIITTIASYNMETDSVGYTAEMCAMSAAAFIDGDLAEEIIAAGEIPPEKLSAWEAQKKSLDNALATLEANNAIYLYVMAPVDDDGNTHYYMSADDRDGTIPFWEEDSADVFDTELFDSVIGRGEYYHGGIYDSGDYGMCLSGYAPVRNSDGKVVAGVGLDMSIEQVYDEMSSFVIVSTASAIALLIIEIIVISALIRRKIAAPIKELTGFAKAIASGNFGVKITEITGNNEISELKRSFAALIEVDEKQSSEISRIASGDLTAEIEVRTQNDIVGKSLAAMEKSLRELIGKITAYASSLGGNTYDLDRATEEFTVNANDGVHSVGLIKETTTDFQKEINNIAGKAETEAENCMKTADVTDEGKQKMEELSSAVSDIKESGQQIGSVIKLIDDIAFQTNILALNASVEAARAGAHGKGFAVVAEEVRNLAAKSAQAAKDSQKLISITIEKAVAGAAVCSEAESYFDKISDNVKASNSGILELSSEMRELNLTIESINRDIDNLSNVLASNLNDIDKINTLSVELKETSSNLTEQANVFKVN